jgi:hypothetical protein
MFGCDHSPVGFFIAGAIGALLLTVFYSLLIRRLINFSFIITITCGSLLSLFWFVSFFGRTEQMQWAIFSERLVQVLFFVLWQGIIFGLLQGLSVKDISKKVI